MTPLPVNNLVLICASLAAIPLGLFLAVLLFRSACDLCSIEPPGWLKSVGIVVLLGVLTAPLGYGMMLAVSALGRTSGMSDVSIQIVGWLVSLPFQALVAGLLYRFLIPVKYFLGTLIWGIQALLSVLVMVVLGLFVVGCFTIVEGVLRVF